MQTSVSYDEAQIRAAARAHRNNQRLVILGKYAILIILTIIIMGPVATAFLGSIRTNGEFLNRPFDLPRHGIQWQHYTDILEDDMFWSYAKNSIIMTLGVVTMNVILASMLAFAFSRIKFFGRNLVFNILSIGLLFPTVVAILPIFIQIRNLGLINSRWGVVMPMVAFGLPGSVLILRSFFIAIPDELEDAAYIDGCTLFGFFRYILLPISRPALSAVATLQVIYAWNEYFIPLLVLTDQNKWPLPLGIMQFQGEFGSDWSRIMAYVTILIIPAVLFYLVTEKLIVTGLTGGELKG
jgi:raffinose/stachyose/melibiose transport system permease protein